MQGLICTGRLVVVGNNCHVERSREPEKHADRPIVQERFSTALEVTEQQAFYLAITSLSVLFLSPLMSVTI
jgi:hypothetical protein